MSTNNDEIARHHFKKIIKESNKIFTYVPTEDGNRIVCNYIDCMAGMGLAGNGRCFLQGNPFDSNCQSFVKEKD